MRIMCKYKDYYDYACDASDGLVFERKPIAEITNQAEFLEWLSPEEWLKHKDIAYKNKQFMITAGYYHYLTDCDLETGKSVLLGEYRNDLFFINNPIFLVHAPLMIVSLRVYPIWSRRKLMWLHRTIELTGDFQKDVFLPEKYNWKKVEKYLTDFSIKHPILKNLGLSHLVSAQTIAQNIEEYLFSTKSQPEPLPISDELKAKNHGFDNNSFRGKFTGRKHAKSIAKEGQGGKND